MTFHSKSGIAVEITQKSLDFEQGITQLLTSLDHRLGIVMSSGIEYPGRYSRWDLGVVDPPLALVAQERSVTITALNERGERLIVLFKHVLAQHDQIKIVKHDSRYLLVSVDENKHTLPEEHRSQQLSVVTPLRIIIDEFQGIPEPHFGFYGAFGYELIYQFEPIELAFKRGSEDKIFHLFWVDKLTLVDRKKESAFQVSAEFNFQRMTTKGASTDPFVQLVPSSKTVAGKTVSFNHDDSQYAQMVSASKEKMKVGDIFEVVLSRKLSVDFEGSAVELYRRMQKMNPSPYEFICQFGDEQLVGTSPEMFVRVQDKYIESCPISGTIRRGKNAMEDEANIRALLNSAKDEVELTMCTDVDRNDKSRICEPGSVELISRRSIEKYVGLFHTVDHVKGQLRAEFTGIDGFLSHMWAVTLTGAPKKSAIQAIENAEKTSRNWYGGAVGYLALNGDVNTCITIRTIHLRKKKAYYQVGATLVWDSEPTAEVEETKVKATPFYKALDLTSTALSSSPRSSFTAGKGLSAVMIDNEDSFVHTLADYFRQCGMKVTTFRAGITVETILGQNPDLVIHSPGPGRPEDFNVPQLIQQLAKKNIPQFGVCLGLQGLVLAFGGKLTYLEHPHHGKIWRLKHTQKGVMKGLAQNCQVAAYHSIIADKGTLPKDLEMIAENEHGHVMAIKHRTLPIQAVQFHPESILSMQDDLGLSLINNAIEQLCKPAD